MDTSVKRQFFIVNQFRLPRCLYIDGLKQQIQNFITVFDYINLKRTCKEGYLWVKSMPFVEEQENYFNDVYAGRIPKVEGDYPRFEGLVALPWIAEFRRYNDSRFNYPLTGLYPINTYFSECYYNNDFQKNMMLKSIASLCVDITRSPFLAESMRKSFKDLAAEMLLHVPLIDDTFIDQLITDCWNLRQVLQVWPKYNVIKRILKISSPFDMKEFKIWLLACSNPSITLEMMIEFVGIYRSSNVAFNWSFEGVMWVLDLWSLKYCPEKFFAQYKTEDELQKAYWIIFREYTNTVTPSITVGDQKSLLGIYRDILLHAFNYVKKSIISTSCLNYRAVLLFKTMDQVDHYLNVKGTATTYQHTMVKICREVCVLSDDWTRVSTFIYSLWDRYIEDGGTVEFLEKCALPLIDRGGSFSVNALFRTWKKEMKSTTEQ
jgi:hypothetical protein